MSKKTDKTAGDGANKYSRLREDAERFLYDYNKQQPVPEKDIKALFQELQVHQIELEMQNDELRLANTELERQRSRFSGLYDLAPVGYFILDRAGVIKDVNEIGKNLLKTGKGNIVDRRLQSFIAADGTDAFYHFFMRMLKIGGRQYCELKVKHFNGGSFHARVEGIALNENEELWECYVALIDISERIRSEQELMEIKERLELSLKASLAGTWELDLQTMNFFLDESSQRICNIAQGGFEGKLDDFIYLIHPADRALVEERFRSSLNSHREIDIVCRFGQLGNKTCYTVIRGHLISVAGANARFVGIIMDITETTHLERSANRLKNEYQRKIATATIHTEENERKRISSVLHDSVSQLLYGIQMQLGQLDKTRRPSNINSIKKLLDQAIEETRNISFELAPSILTDFGLAATIEELVKRLSSVNLSIHVKISGLFKRMDLLLETNIYRIIQELINNCMKHSGASEINIQLIKNKTIEIIVNDNGRGYNVKEKEMSTSGSGLSSIRNRLSLYNGNITVRSETGKGTTVHVKLHENIPAFDAKE